MKQARPVAGRLVALALVAAAGAHVARAADIAPAGDVAAGEAATADAGAADFVPTGIYVTIDQAKVIRIDYEADTVIIGNPAIADAVLYDRRTLVITGRAYGATNILIMDDKGELIVDEALRVQPPADTMVTVHRQALTFTYSCTPLCKPAVAPGDENVFFDGALKQSQARNEFAAEAAGAKQ